MTPKEAATELEYAVAAAITRYESQVPGVVIGIFVDRVPGGGFKVKPKLHVKPAGLADQKGAKVAGSARL